MERIRLCELPHGAAGRVCGLCCAGAMRRRLLELGLIEGTSVRRELRSPLGDPTAYRVRGSLIALRRGDAADIWVRPEEGSENPARAAGGRQ